MVPKEAMIKTILYSIVIFNMCYKCDRRLNFSTLTLLLLRKTWLLLILF